MILKKERPACGSHVVNTSSPPDEQQKMVKSSMELNNVPNLFETENSTFVSADNLTVAQKNLQKKRYFCIKPGHDCM